MLGISAQKTTTVMDPISKTVYGTIQLGLANNIYDKLFNDEDTNPKIYKTSWLLDTVASGHSAEDKMIVRDKKKIQPGTGINIGYVDKGILNKT